MKLSRCFCFLFVCSLSFTTARADVKMSNLFSDHMVLQRDMPVPVWGTAQPNEKVTVAFRSQEKSTVADANGKWQVKLDPLKAGGPDKLTVTTTNTLTFNDVLVGEVWVGSGQSNMEMPVGSYVRGDSVLSNLVSSSHPEIRLASARMPWKIATPEDSARFSALLFSFGVYLQKSLDVPVGLMIGAVSGTPSGPWLTQEMLDSNPDYTAAVAREEAAAPFAARQAVYEKSLEQYKADLAKWQEQAAATQSVALAVEAAPVQKKLPPKPLPPRAPVKAGEIPGKPGQLYRANIEPLQPYAIRGVLWDQGESGTSLQGIDQLTVMGSLISGWRKAWGEGEFPFLYIEKPSGGGCAWDRSNPVTKNASVFTAPPPLVPADGAFVDLHIKIMKYPRTAMVISSDLGGELHPTNKSGYGNRSAQVALGMVYDQKIEYYGPLYASHKIESNTVRVSFTHIGKGLAAKPADKLQGFALAGADGVYHWAEARIDGDTVVLSSAAVPQPVQAWYACSMNHPWANLFNQDGLPAIPFRTDWK